jgi:environmental stress-induced protein Ves
MCECEFSYGSYVVRSEDNFIEQQTKRVERSLSLLKTDNFSLLQMDRFQSIVISGITPLTFKGDKVINSILQERVQVMRKRDVTLL